MALADASEAAFTGPHHEVESGIPPRVNMLDPVECGLTALTPGHDSIQTGNNFRAYAATGRFAGRDGPRDGAVQRAAVGRGSLALDVRCRVSASSILPITWTL